MEAIRCDIKGPIAEIVLDRPEEGNTFTPQLLSELAEATTELATNRDVRAVVLRGSGPHFCYGANVDMFVEAAEGCPALIRDLVTRLHTAVARLGRLEVPLLGVAHGTVVGGGLALLAACDVVLAAESTKFLMGWSGIGITMDGASTWTLPRIIGPHRTLELIYTNRVFTAVEAHQWGLVNWLAPPDEVESRTTELATMLASGATPALGLCRRLVIEGASESFETQLENEAVALTRVVATHDAQEGFRAFSERRPPVFTGE